MRLILYPIVFVLAKIATFHIAGCAAFQRHARFTSRFSCSHHLQRMSPAASTSYPIPEDVSSSSSTRATSLPVVESPVDEDDMITVPWSEWQDWALRDNLPKYIITIPPPHLTSQTRTNKTPLQTRQFALWRSMLHDVPELNGYDVAFVRQMYAKQLLRNAQQTITGRTTKIDVPGVLPLLEQFEFEPNDGISGIAFGLPGIADGTKMTTPPLKNVQQTIPLGYVYTDEGETVTAYEIGTPKQSEFHSLDGRSATAVNAAKVFFSSALETSSKVGEQTSVSSGSLRRMDPETSQMLLNVGGATVMLLAGATAVNMLSHHLTVNVFWV